MKQLRYDALALAFGSLVSLLVMSTMPTVQAAQRGQTPPARPATPPAGQRQGTPAPRPAPRLGQTPGDGTFHIPFDQKGNACTILWDQAIGANAPDVVDTVNAYTYIAITDNIQPGVPVAPLGQSVPFCSGTASPYSCAANYVVPISQQTPGSHTLTLYSRDTSGQLSASSSIPFVIDPPVVGPPPAPSNLRFKTGGTARP